jgi:branched-chain amino acid transport system substrate-binding protein
MYFPQGTTADEQLFGVLATGARRSGKVNFGTLTCAELQVCRDADRLWSGEHAQALKLHPVYRAQVSISQPDFTAECLGAKQAGAEMLAMAIDINSAYRIGAACNRVGYHPAYTVPYSAVASQEARDPNLDGLMAATPTFPYVLSDTPATSQFATAMKTYASGVELSASASVGWTAGKLFEQAAANIGDPPSRDRLLAALWAMRGDTLGGLTQPLTFPKDAPAPRNRCWFVMQISGGRGTAPSGGTPSCP